ncbi:MAG: hypothetical protein IPL49_02180 [Saprospirales bacterium]|nr:hypothetical protein [Saprospirales bacterium]
MSGPEDFPDQFEIDFLGSISGNVKRSMEVFDHLSPADVSHILWGPFQPKSPIQYRSDLSAETLKKVPFFQLFLYFLRRIEQAGEIKLTATGRLPRAIVRELYEAGSLKTERIIRGHTQLFNEDDVQEAVALHILVRISGLVKMRNKKISLTKKGRDMLGAGDELSLFRLLFHVHFSRFNWGYFDGYSPAWSLQRSGPYSLYLLLRYGREARKLEYYVDKVLDAFPFLLMDFPPDWSSSEKQFLHCYEIRLLSFFLDWYGFSQTRHSKKYSMDNVITVQASDLFYEVFDLDGSKFQFERPEGEA